MNDIDISIVIPVKNGQRYLDSVLRAIFSQEINAKFEVIIIDSGSTDQTIDIARKYPVKFYQIKPEEFNHGLTRNFAISKSNGKYIVLMTADAIPYDRYWMANLIENFKGDPSIVGVYSRQIPHRDAQALTQIRVNRYFTSGKARRENQINNIEDYHKLSPKEKHRFCNFDNVSSCIRKEVWEKIPFSKTDFAEDLEWSEKVLKTGYKVIYEPKSVVYHSHDFSLYGWYKKNWVNYNKLFNLFGLNSIDNLYKLFSFFFFYTLRDIYFLFKDNRKPKVILSNIHLIPFYSFFGALGQYRSIKNPYPHP